MNCNIIKDLLPLYHDDVISEESRELVEEHLKTCLECRNMLEDIKENTKAKNDSSLEKPIISGLKVLKKRLHRKAVLTVAASIICAVSVVAALFYGVFFYETPVSYIEMTQTATQSIDSELDFITNEWSHNSISIIKDGDVLYYCYSDTFWTRYVAKPNRQPIIRIYSFIEPELPELPKLPEMSEIPEIPEAPDVRTIIGEVTKIYYLEGNLSKLAQNYAAFSKISADAVLVWEK